MALLSFVGYLYDRDYSEESHLTWIVYLTGACAVIFLFFAIVVKGR